jgi:hypothetical protein
MTQTVQPVRASVVVGVDQKRAFEVFADQMTSWWPASHHIGEAPIQEIVIEPFVGGRWYTTPTDDGRTLVQLEHRDLEAYGEKAEQMRETFEGPEAWGGMLKIYRDVAEASA